MSDDLGATINLSWTPPAPSDWNFTKSTEICAAAAQWTGTYIIAISTFEEEGRHPVPISFSVDYLYAILPSDFYQNTTNASLTTWYYLNNLDNSKQSSDECYGFWDKFTRNFAIDNCSTELCQKIGWKEDPDVAGVGMLLSYYIVAVLTTIYYFALLIPRPSQNNDSQDDNQAGFFTKVWKAFRKTANKFLLADLIFTVGMLGAALWRFHSASADATIPYTIFNQLASFFMSCFSVLSCLVLQTVAQPKRSEPRDRNRHLYRWTLALPWVSISSMILVLFILHLRDYPRLIGDPSSISMERLYERQSQLAEFVWLYECDPAEIRKKLEIVLYMGLAVLTLNAAWFSLALAYRVFRWRVVRKAKGSTSSRGKETDNSHFRVLRLLDGLGCIVMMWAFLIVFHIYRDKSHDNAGPSDGGSKDWSFGQILAMAAWAPTLIELCNRIFPDVLVNMYNRPLFSKQHNESDDMPLVEYQPTPGHNVS